MTPGREHVRRWWEARLASMTEEERAAERKERQAQAEQWGARLAAAKQEAERKVTNLKLTPPRDIDELLAMAMAAGLPREEAGEMTYHEITERVKEHLAMERYQAEMKSAIGNPKGPKRKRGRKPTLTDKQMKDIIDIADEYDSDLDAGPGKVIVADQPPISRG